MNYLHLEYHKLVSLRLGGGLVTKENTFWLFFSKHKKKQRILSLLTNPTESLKETNLSTKVSIVPCLKVLSDNLYKFITFWVGFVRFYLFQGWLKNSQYKSWVCFINFNFDYLLCLHSNCSARNNWAKSIAIALLIFSMSFYKF